jgi:ribosomal protein S6
MAQNLTYLISTAKTGTFIAIRKPKSLDTQKSFKSIMKFDKKIGKRVLFKVSKKLKKSVKK